MWLLAGEAKKQPFLDSPPKKKNSSFNLKIVLFFVQNLRRIFLYIKDHLANVVSLSHVHRVGDNTGPNDA